MLQCTYLVLIHNNVQNIKDLIASLKAIKGNFRKEFIFIDDGSSDDSLSVLKKETKDLARSTIITQERQGGSISINKATSLARGDFIHFVEGDEILHKDSSSALIKSALEHDQDVAIGNVTFSKKNFVKNLASKNQIIEDPIKNILSNSKSICRRLGLSGSLINRKLLEKIGKADKEVYIQNISLALRAAKYTKFVHLSDNVSHVVNRPVKYDVSFESYNVLKSIYNFTKKNNGLMSSHIVQLLKCLKDETKNNRCKIKYSFKYMFGRYIKAPNINKTIKLYELELEKLF